LRFKFVTNLAGAVGFDQRDDIFLGIAESACGNLTFNMFTGGFGDRDVERNRGACLSGK
jgi:hypothetical protein